MLDISLIHGIPRETVRKVPIGFDLRPQKPTRRVEEALLRCWRTAIRSFYTPL
jgi:hypothetical protein